MSVQVILTLECLEQAYVLRDALDLYSRLGIGQLEMVEELFRKEDIPAAMFVTFDERMQMAEALQEILAEAKRTLGFSRNGSMGIGGPSVPIGAQRAYEVQKVLAKALAEHREPNPSFKGTSYDGLVLRYTKDPLPVAKIVPAAAAVLVNGDQA